MSLFKNPMKKFKTMLQNFKTWRTRVRVKAEYGSEYHSNVQKEREITCVINGHVWDHDFDPSSVDGRKLSERTFCKVCGVKFHKHTYQKI